MNNLLERFCLSGEFLKFLSLSLLSEVGVLMFLENFYKRKKEKNMKLIFRYNKYQVNKVYYIKYMILIKTLKLYISLSVQGTSYSLL